MRPTGLMPSKEDLTRLYSKEGKSVRAVAQALGLSKDMIARALKAYKIKARSNARRSRLRTIPLAELEAAIRDKGIRGTARELGIVEGTIRHHLKVRRGH
jgi:transposase-like protein